MSDKQPAPEDFRSWREYWKARGMPWRTEPEIDTERQHFLAARRTVQPDIDRGVYPFRDADGPLKLTRADVEWLLATHYSGGIRGPVDWSDQKQRGREGLDLRGADLSAVDLRGLPLAGLHASLTFDEADEVDEDAKDMVDAAAVALSWANLRGAHLEGAWLRRVDLSNANLRSAWLARAELYNARLAGAQLGLSHLGGASLRRAVLSADTNLYGAQLNDATFGAARLRDIRWDGADVSTIDWTQVTLLGDEQVIRTRRRARWNDFPNATRAYRQLAVLLLIRRFRESHPKVRSTTKRFGSTAKPRTPGVRSTTSRSHSPLEALPICIS